VRLFKTFALALTRRSHGEHGEHPEQLSGCKRNTFGKWPWTWSGEMEVVVCESIDLAYRADLIVEDAGLLVLPRLLRPFSVFSV
jgi:hypothetical protein